MHVVCSTHSGCTLVLQKCRALTTVDFLYQHIQCSKLCLTCPTDESKAAVDPSAETHQNLTQPHELNSHVITSSAAGLLMEKEPYSYPRLCNLKASNWTVSQKIINVKHC